jgi:hypothetical protein
MGVGKKRLTAVLCTISSSNPRSSEMRSSIHCVMTTIELGFVRGFTDCAKFTGNFVVRSSFAMA